MTKPDKDRPIQEPEQLLLDLARDPAFSREDLIETPANHAAIALIDAWPNWSSPVAVIHGPPGSGKSHIAAVWCDRTGASPANANAIGGQAIDHAIGGGSALVENTDRSELDQTGLFHLVNAIRQGGGTLLLTARNAPSDWPLSLPDLLSRLRSAALAEIGRPDDALLQAILVKLFSDRQIEIDIAVINYLLPRMERSLHAAATLVEAMDREAMTRRSAVTRPLAGDVLRKMQSSDPSGD